MNKKATSFLPDSNDEPEVIKESKVEQQIGSDDFLGVKLMGMQKKHSSNVKAVTDDDLKYGKGGRFTTRRSKNSLDFKLPMSKSKSAAVQKITRKFTMIQKTKDAGKPVITKEQQKEIEQSIEKTIVKKLTDKPSILDNTSWWSWINFTWTFNLIAVSILAYLLIN